MRQVAAAHGLVPFIFQQDSAPAHRAQKNNGFFKERQNPLSAPLLNGPQIRQISNHWTLQSGVW